MGGCGLTVGGCGLTTGDKLLDKEHPLGLEMCGGHSLLCL